MCIIQKVIVNAMTDYLDGKCNIKMNKREEGKTTSSIIKNYLRELDTMNVIPVL